jgi:hypothetical protein
MHDNELCHTRCYMGHVPYAHGLWSGPTNWIIRWITHKRKSAKLLFIQTNEWIFILYITHYTFLWCRYITTPVVCTTLVVWPTPVGRRDSGRMPDSSQKTWLWSYILTLVPLPDSGQCHDFGRISWLRSLITAIVDEHAACLTTSTVKDFAWPG